MCSKIFEVESQLWESLSELWNVICVFPIWHSALFQNPFLSGPNPLMALQAFSSFHDTKIGAMTQGLSLPISCDRPYISMPMIFSPPNVLPFPHPFNITMFLHLLDWSRHSHIHHSPVFERARSFLASPSLFPPLFSSPGSITDDSADHRHVYQCLASGRGACCYAEPYYRTRVNPRPVVPSSSGNWRKHHLRNRRTCPSSHPATSGDYDGKSSSLVWYFRGPSMTFTSS